MIEADKKETIIVGYAFLEDESEEERAALQRRLEKTFGTDHLLYLAGDKEDVENAKKAGKSLGIYLAEQILAGENFHKVVNEATEEEVLELLEKNPCSMTDQALKEMIPWGELGCHLAETLKNGKEVVNAVEKYKPDIVILDIQMPLMTGMEAAQWIHENYPDIVVVLLTAYEDFKYAQQAIVFQVKRYVIKNWKKFLKN